MMDSAVAIPARYMVGHVSPDDRRKSGPKTGNGREIFMKELRARRIGLGDLVSVETTDGEPTRYGLLLFSTGSHMASFEVYGSWSYDEGNDRLNFDRETGRCVVHLGRLHSITNVIPYDKVLAATRADWEGVLTFNESIEMAGVKIG